MAEIERQPRRQRAEQHDRGGRLEQRAISARQRWRRALQPGAHGLGERGGGLGRIGRRRLIEGGALRMKGGHVRSRLAVTTLKHPAVNVA
ncbi:MAG: hypothetical protein B7Z14_06085 [Bosea sp. 32-68-6]|nr:MAG: hypothetical protein B7Z14_06085 [Bosea sp. 32-68-6]